MHHEIFFALLGHTGDVVQAREDGFFIADHIKFVTDPQKVMINRVLQLGYAFAHLEQFTKRAREFQSMYLRGFAQGVDQILSSYTNKIVQLEAKILTTHIVFPIPQMMYELEEYAELFPQLIRLVKTIQGQGTTSNVENHAHLVTGSRLLELMYRNTQSGFPRIRLQMEQLLYCCHRVLFKQMVSWMLYGEVVDPYTEFFIRRGHDISRSEDTTPLVNEGAEIWQRPYSVDLDAVPLLYFPISVAESVLFIGKSVQILSRGNGFSSQEIQTIIDGMATLSSNTSFNVITLEHVVEEIRRYVAGRLYHEVVVKSDFVEHLHVLKGMFLLSRGELFQALIERSDSLMATKPTHKSEEEVRHSIWEPILRDFQLDEEPWTKQFSFNVPLQCLHYPNFGVHHGLILANMIRRSSNGNHYFEVEDPVKCGAVWFPYRQRERSHAFLCEYDVEVVAKQGLMHGEIRDLRAALFLTPVNSFSVPEECAERNQELQVIGDNTRLVTIELIIRSRGSGTSVSVHIGSPFVETCDEDVAMANAPPFFKVPLTDKNKLHVQVQSAKVESKDVVSGKLLIQRMVIVTVNDVVVLEETADIGAMLGRMDASNGYYMGIGFTSSLRLHSWKVEKFGVKAITTRGKCIKTGNPSLSARELWDNLTLRCELKWPIQLLVSPTVLQSYEQLFQFCFKLKRVVHSLERTWKCNALRSRHDVNVAAACTLRGRMNFVLRNIQLYFQVFIIESSFSTCITEIESASDFDKVKRLHECFVAHMVKQCYLHTRTVSHSLDEMIRCCWEFIDYLSYQDQVNGKLSSDRIVYLNEQFTDKFKCLFQVLQHIDARDLVSLLDYNEYMTTLMIP